MSHHTSSGGVCVKVQNDKMYVNSETSLGKLNKNKKGYILSFHEKLNKYSNTYLKFWYNVHIFKYIWAFNTIQFHNQLFYHNNKCFTEKFYPHFKLLDKVIGNLIHNKRSISEKIDEFDNNKYIIYNDWQRLLLWYFYICMSTCVLCWYDTVWCWNEIKVILFILLLLLCHALYKYDK
jgi:hypothetical protein